ncbi:vacuolar protein sorting-associated protein [Angomonas deanei]|nr:vacuolar protein sorting-associated protein [Angomonas deanei]|eukprot:EPY31633.1 vacuolar protein sorting-associated protein [Angomonas deanei]
MLQHERLPEKQSGPSFFGKLLRKVDGCDLSFEFDHKEESEKIAVDDLYNNVREQLHLYQGNEPVTGRVTLLPSGASYRHLGVTIQLIGMVKTVAVDENNVRFLSQEIKFEPDTINGPTPLNFSFAAVKPYESYRGINASVAYYVRASVGRTVKNITGKQEIWVTGVDEEQSEKQANASAHRSYFRETVFGSQSIAMDVGVDDRLHIEFRYDKGIFHLQERVMGKVTFKVADLDIQYGEIGVVRKEVYQLQ